MSILLKLTKNALGMLIGKYRAVLKKRCFKKAGVLAGCCLLTLAPAGALAEDISYNGAGSSLKLAPPWFFWSPGDDRSFFPGTTNIPGYASNMVTVDYDPASPGVTNPNYVFGGLSENNNVTYNSVIIRNGNVEEEIYGGYSENGAVTGNSVNISGGTINSVTGGESNTGSVENNSVTISGVTVRQYGNIYGGSSWEANAKNNSVNISDVTLTLGVVCGGESWLAAENNTVNISGGNVSGSVYGGTGAEGAVNNSVTISGDATVGRWVIGGSSWGGDAAGNRVDIYDNATVNGVIYGGESDEGTTHNNSVNISGGTVTGEIIGGDSDLLAEKNRVNISGGIVTGWVYGGISWEGTAAENNVTIDGGTVNALNESCGVYGGYSDSGVAQNNSVTIKGGAVVNNNVYGGVSWEGTAIGNAVDIYGDSKVTGTILGGYSDSADVNNNSVNLYGNAVATDEIYGGWSNGTGGMVWNNTVTIDGGTVKTLYGGYSEKYLAVSNTVNITGGTITGDVYGGYSQYHKAYFNEVNISGGTITGDVYGGYSDVLSEVPGEPQDTHAIENTVTLSGSPNLTSADIYGGGTSVNQSDPHVDTFSENALYVYGNQQTASINNFQNYGFLLPASMMSGETLLLTGGWTNSGNDPLTVEGIAIESGGTYLKAGDTVNLIEVANGGAFPTNGLSDDTVKGQKGVSLLYDFTLDIDDTEQLLTATVDSVGVHPQTKALAEGRLATLGFLNQGADLIAGKGMADALLKAQGSQTGKEFFGTISYGSSRYKTGSHADVDGINLLTGIAWKSENEKSSLLTGVFLEGGWGNYNTYNSFTSLPNINSSGDASYYGLGFLARRDSASGGYLEGSIRFGKSKTTFNSGDFLNNLLQEINVGYTSKPAYYGAHLGVGRLRANGNKTVDYYAKYFYTHQNGDDLIIAGGDPLHFSSSDSNRLRAGARLTHNRPDGRISIYYGAAYEHEFSAKARASVYGLDIDAPSIKGGTGIFEIGMNWKKEAASPNSLALSLQGYVGKYQGLSGNIQFKRVF